MSAIYNLDHTNAVFNLLNLGNAMEHATKVRNNLLFNLSQQANTNINVVIISSAIFALSTLAMYLLSKRATPNESKKHNWSLYAVAGVVISGIVMGIFSQKVINLYDEMHTQYVIDLAH